MFCCEGYGFFLSVFEGMRVLMVFSVVTVIYLRVCICCEGFEGYFEGIRVFSVVRVIYLRVCICCDDNEGIWVLMVIRVFRV